MTRDSAELLTQYREGDAEAAAAIFVRYSGRLLALVQSRLSERLARRVHADDIVQSAYRSFFVHAREGAFTLENEGDLWRLLAAITLHKLRRQARRQGAAKRAVGREVAADSQAAEPLASVADRNPTPDDALAAEEELRWLLSHFEELPRQAFLLRLQGHTLEQIAVHVKRNERTVRRWFADAQALLAERLGDERSPRDANTGAATHTRVPLVPDAQAPLNHANYHLIRLIGAGGMCKVYAATEVKTGAQVAVKVLRKGLRRKRQLVQRFVDEAQIVARFNHEHIVGVHGLGRLPYQGFFMVLDFVAGENLAQLVARERVSPSRAADIVATVAEAIDYAHYFGVVHRDLKPANILLDQAGKVFVTDFGFAWTESEKMAGSPAIIGTQGFMAPEQSDAACGPIGPHTDVYGLGALLWAILTGGPSPPSRIDPGQPADATGCNQLPFTDVPESLRAICRRCLAVEWSRRYATAREVAEALRSFLTTAKTRAAPILPPG